ncbi:hypothetical protein Agub_g10129 [Astrephomene gubernaculifera]|uniref:Protein-S-isoprenylcysteine O-methyltransferase n=1 Tax=Astrephomene gubernaculifera TaxID=47775 RepID=A0AAD3DWC6_9CHLO|nr:hypothetical protein Agub_g10129 [Astrephomene gubernaculifera]
MQSHRIANCFEKERSCLGSVSKRTTACPLRLNSSVLRHPAHTKLVRFRNSKCLAANDNSDEGTAKPSQPGLPSPSGSSSPAPNDDNFARVWKPPPGEPPLWWVEKFEARRKAEAERKAEDPAYMTTQERVAPAAASGGNPVLRFFATVLQFLQLLLVLGLLLLLPAAMHDGGLSLAKPYTTFAAYLLFFGAGSVFRVVRHGKLTPRKQDRQVASWAGRLAFAAFVLVVPLLHMYGMYRYVGLALYTDRIPTCTTLYDIVGGVGMLVATVLNAVAASELGASYDRVAAPPALVTSGPYSYMQHPIYTSYMLLFFSVGMWLHSAPTAIAMLLVCALYYRGRTALEARVLEEAFGGHYREYAQRTRKYLPFLL